MKKLKIRSKLLLSFGVVLILTVIISVFSILQLEKANSNLKDFMEGAVAADDAVKNAEKYIDTSRADHASQRRGHPPCLDSVNDGSDERKRGSKENGHFSPRAQLEDQRPHSRREQRHVAVQPGQQRHQHQRTEGDKQHLCTKKTVLEPETIDNIIIGHKHPLKGLDFSNVR